MTAVIIALCLISLFGMLVLVVDVGGLLWKRREMVSGADAAALAAAKTCSVPVANDPTDPQVQADTAAVANVGGLNGADGAIVDNPWNCSVSTRVPRGYITVQYSYPQKLFFAGIFGASSRTVTTAATAAWGRLRVATPCPSSSSRVSSRVRATSLISRSGRAATSGTTTGAPRSATRTGDSSTSTSGMLRPRQTAAPLEVEQSRRLHPEQLRQRIATCRAGADVRLQHDRQRNGQLAGSERSDERRALQQDRAVPRSRPPDAGQRLRPADRQEREDRPCGSGTPDKFAIIGFTTLKLSGIYKGNDPAAIGVPNASGNCPNNATLGTASAGVYGFSRST